MDETKPEILIGTSGYSYDDWRGKVYPKDIAVDEMLPFYAKELGFSLVEINDTYFTMPTVSGMEGLINQTPDNFQFVIKANQELTKKLWDESGHFLRNEYAVETFLEGMEPMFDSNRLIGILAQFPYSFTKSRDSIEHLKWFAGRLKPRTELVVEFKHESWTSLTIFDLLKSLDVGFCIIDAPDHPKFPLFTPVGTSSLGYFRLYGRNINWSNVPINEGYNYKYTEFELRELLTPIHKISAMTDRTVIFFNNHYQGTAVKNAWSLKKLL